MKWIKIVTDIFDDEKILLIESLPESDAIIVIWFKLLTLAGKQNNNGVFLMSNRIPYTDEMLATIFRRNVNVVRLALRALEQYGMIEIIDNVITIPNWNKHQTLDAYEKKKERDRLYQQERRAVQRALVEGKSSDKSSDTSSDVAISDKDRDKDKDVEEDKEKNISKRKRSKKTEQPKHKYGEFNNVLLTDDELEKLKAKFPDWASRIENLSYYLKSKGKKYTSHYGTILNWARRDGEKNGQGNGSANGQAGKYERLIETGGLGEWI